MSDYENVLMQSRAQWREWLARHHASSPGIWLVTWKKGSGRPHLRYEDIVEEALCFGWVDSRPRSLDDSRSALLVSPRRPASNWSRLNKQRAERLIQAGRMTPAGLNAVETAKSNGAWDALNQVEDLIEPPDLARALDATPPARGYWDQFPRSARRAILEWIGNAKTESTRRLRIERTVSDAASNIRANQWRQPKSGGPSAG
ncbi:MAG TPA: YdeI/OmpD-associated family protein [Streptosporangiaceae bacterium]